MRNVSILATLVLLISGCAFSPSTAKQALHGIQTGNEVLYELRKEPLNNSCRRAAEACSGQVKTSGECKKWAQCDAIRTLFDEGQSLISEGLSKTEKGIKAAQQAGWLDKEE